MAPCTPPWVSPHPHLPSTVPSAMASMGQTEAGMADATPSPRQPGRAVCSRRDGPPSPAPVHARPSGMTAARPPSVPCVSLTGQRPGAVNHEPIGRSQQEARRTQRGDAAIKAISARLAGQMKAQLMGRAGQALLWHRAAALAGATQGRAHAWDLCARENPLSVQGSWHGHLVLSPLPTRENSLQVGQSLHMQDSREVCFHLRPRGSSVS